MPAETHVEHGPLGREEIFEIVRDRLADILEIDPATINEGQSFADDLEADSLALIELVEALEEELADRTVGFRIEDEDLEDLKTVRDAVDYVHERTGEAPELHALAARLGYDFADESLLRRAMAHRSWVSSTQVSRATSAWSSWATRCSAGSWPTSPSGVSPSSPRVL